MKGLVLIAAGIVGLVVAFSLTSGDEIAAEIDMRLDEDFVSHCVARAQFPAELPSRAPNICRCMKREFANRGMKLTDAFGEKKTGM